MNNADVVSRAVTGEGVETVSEPKGEKRNTRSVQLRIDGSSPSIRSITRDVAVPFLQRWHYLTFVPNKTNNTWLGLFSRNDHLRGVICIADYPTGKGILAKLFPSIWRTMRCAELSRMCLVDDWPTNSETVFLSRVLRRLKTEGFDAVISYADQSAGHEGTIYRASNWTFAGKTSPERRLFIDGTEIHPRTCVGRYGSRAVLFLDDKFGNRFTSYRDKGKLRFVYIFTKRARRAFRNPA